MTFVMKLKVALPLTFGLTVWTTVEGLALMKPSVNCKCIPIGERLWTEFTTIIFVTLSSLRFECGFPYDG